MKKTIKPFSARAAMMLLATLLLTMTAQTAWADNVTLSVDNDYNNTDVGYYYAKMPNSPNVKSTLTLNEEGVTACNGAFKLYDSGGKNYNYNAEKDYGTKFTIEVPDDYVLNITGSSRSTYDHNWNIYDSSDKDDSKLLINLRQENNDIDVTTTGKYVTIHFQAPTSSNRQYSQWGLNLTVKLLSATNSIPLSTITGIKRVYKRTGSAISLGYTVKSLSNVTLTKDVDFTETITKNGTVVDNAVENGDYTLTIAGKDPYFGKQTFDFSVSDNDYISVSSDTKVMYNCAYKVQQNVTISDRIVVNGDVTLTLEEGYTLTAQSGIEVEAGNTLTIDGTGSLTIPTGDNYCAGIGSNNGKEYGHIIINGGIITTEGGQYGAGIGGGYENVDNGNCSITINGGVINATGAARAAGIGGGYGGAHNNNPRGAAGTIIINGGQVTASYKEFSGSKTYCGIGHGYMYSGGGGSLTLDWTRESDFINCFKYNITNINFGGKDFVLDEDNTVTATISNIDGKKIIPKLDNLVLNHATMNNLCSLYRYTGSEIALGYTIKSTDGTTTLVKGTNYSETITKGGVTSIVKDKGEYTLTITGLGSYYTGTKSYTFSVADIDEDLTQDGSEYYVNFPADGSTKTVNLIENQTIKVYDSEGKNGSLVVSDGYLLLQAPDGYALEVTGKTDAMRYNTANSLWVNSLTAYEGDNTSNEIINLQTNSDNILLASGGNVMRMRLNVTALYTFASQYGLDLTVRVIPQQLYTITKGTVSNGSIDIADNKTTANTNEMITLTVNPAEGYLLKRITITDTDGGSTLQTIGEDQWYSGVNTISFKMPSRNITITPEFTNSLTAAGGLSMNIDLSGTKECVIPEIVQSFNIRASAVDNPNVGSSATIILRAHNEYCLQATGQIEFTNVSTDDGEISIYDGANTSATLLTNIKGASKDKVSIGTQTSSSNYMTIYLSEEGPYNSVFTGTIETQIKNYSITYDLTGGSVATENPTTYNYKTDDFTLTNPTRDGYTFAGWTGTGLGAVSTSVTVTKGSTGTRSYTATWTENIATLDESTTPLAELTAMSGKQTKVRFERTGLRAGKYSTICLPYDFTASETCTFYTFVGVKKEGDNWVADISAHTGTLEANTPYIFTTTTATSVTFFNDAVTAAAGYSDASANTSVTDWTFQGTYSTISLPNASEYDYGFAAGDGSTVAIGTFVHLKSGASAAPFRAYLKYTGSDDNWAKAPNRAGAANDAMPSRIIVRVVGADGGTTAIGTLDTRTGEISTGEWFDLNGRRLQGKPSTKGIYIHNGKKVVIK